MAKSGFVPAWMKIPSSNKTTGNQKLNFDRTNHPTIISDRQRHYSSDINDHTTTGQKLFSYSKSNGQSRNKSNEQHQSTDLFSFHFRHSSTDMTIKSNDRHELSSKMNTGSKFPFTNNENLSQTFESNRLIARKDRLLSTPDNFLRTNYITQTKTIDKRSDFLNSLKTDLTIEENPNPKPRTNSNQLTKRTLLLLSIPETLEEKEFLIRMGWNDDMNYEITDQDKEEYEKQRRIIPKTKNRSARLISTLNRRTLPCINIQDILQRETIGSASDDDSSDD